MPITKPAKRAKPRVTAAETRAARIERLFELVKLAWRVTTETVYSVNTDFVFDTKDSWGVPGSVGVRFSYPIFRKHSSGESSVANYAEIVLLPDSDDFHYNEVQEHIDIALKAAQENKAFAEERAEVIRGLSTRQRDVLGL